MTTTLGDLVYFLENFASQHSGCTKEAISKATAAHFGLTKERSVFTCNSFSIRFSTAKTGSFSNAVLSLSALQKYDALPFIICVVRPTGIDLLLSNSTFLKKISHSSSLLRIDNIRGSFLGHDILREYEGTKNIPANFTDLFSIHSDFTWEENLARLVEATNNISPTGVRFEPSLVECERILLAANLSAQLSKHPEYIALGDQLAGNAIDHKAQILKAAEIDNVNERGNTIEQIITEGTNVHGIEDFKFVLKVGTTVFVDLKTKLLTLSSSPKGYNIDKVLITLAQGGTVFSFFFLGIDLPARSVSTRLVSILDRSIISATRIQHHWAGRNSRGVTQLTGDLTSLFKPTFVEYVDVTEAKAFLQRLMDLKKAE